MRNQWIAAAAALAVFAGGAASAATEHFTATLTGSDETPPNATTGTGTVDATLDTATKAFSYTVTYSGLTGSAIAAHFHGPAAPGIAAPPVVPVPKEALPSPMTGNAMITDAQAADLDAGKWYFNIHTAAHPAGEVRGQLTLTK
jgi:hypothetical protein